MLCFKIRYLWFLNIVRSAATTISDLLSMGFYQVSLIRSYWKLSCSGNVLINLCSVLKLDIYGFWELLRSAATTISDLVSMGFYQVSLIRSYCQLSCSGNFLINLCSVLKLDVYGIWSVLGLQQLPFQTFSQ